VRMMIGLKNLGLWASLFGAALGLGACSGTSRFFDGGTYPVDASICNCASQGEPCGTQWSCCPNLACVAGACVPSPAPSCAALGEGCGATLPCCVPPVPDGGYPVGSVPPIAACRGNDAGFGSCHIGAAVGDACGPPGGWGCTNSLVCVNGTCQFPHTGVACPRPDAGGCIPGDACYNALVGSGADPCQGWGYDCLATNNADRYVCQVPEVVHPPNFPLAGFASAYSACVPSHDYCEPYPGDSADFGCGQFFTNSAGTPLVTNVCVERCATGDDCGSLAWDCIGGRCIPNYCYAAPDSQNNDIASILASAQGTPVSKDALSTLYKPCANGGPNTTCLPTYDNNWNTTVGLCYRVGAPDAGGIGANCNAAGSRSDVGALCQTGTMCLKGTCLQWCDVSHLGTPCPSTQSCIALGSPFITSSSNGFGVGVCSESCDPYQNAANNGCPVQPCNMPFKVCKPSGIDNDVFPSPGVCVGGVDVPVAVGQACNPFLPRDSCVSGALCVSSPAGGYACEQVCDPSPSAGRTPPACPTSQTCTGLKPPYCFNSTNQAHGYACYHMGVCQ
jgi:hypothetical protein